MRLVPARLPATGPPVLLGAALLGATLSVAALWGAATGNQTDLAVYRLGGRAILSGGGLYDRVVPSTGLPFTYPPFAATLFAPLAPLPRPVAQVAWTALTLAALACLVTVAADYAAPGLTRRAGRLGVPALVGSALLLEPVRHNLGLGQVNVALALALLLDLRRRTGRLPGGVLVGVAAAVKLTPWSSSATSRWPGVRGTRRWRWEPSPAASGWAGSSRRSRRTVTGRRWSSTRSGSAGSPT